MADPIDIPAMSAADLVARLKAPRDTADAENSRNHAYRRVFGSEIGRWVLADMALEAGVATHRGPHLKGDERYYTDGQMDLALEVLKRAGYGPEAVAVFALTENLEGQDHDGRHDGGPGDGVGEPDPQFGD